MNGRDEFWHAASVYFDAARRKRSRIGGHVPRTKLLDVDLGGRLCCRAGAVTRNSLSASGAGPSWLASRPRHGPSGQPAGGIGHDGRHRCDDHGPQHVWSNPRRVGRLGLAGWWGDEPPYHCPVFVLTHYPHDPIEMAGRDHLSLRHRRDRVRLRTGRERPPAGGTSRSREARRAPARRSRPGWSTKSICRSAR